MKEILKSLLMAQTTHLASFGPIFIADILHHSHIVHFVDNILRTVRDKTFQMFVEVGLFLE